MVEGLPERGKIWYNGRFMDWKDAKVHVLAHGLHYGTGVFEGIRCYATDKGSFIFRLDDHIARLYRSAELYKMTIPYTKEELRSAIKDTIRINLSLIHISEPTRLGMISYAVFCLKKKYYLVQIAI